MLFRNKNKLEGKKTVKNSHSVRVTFLFGCSSSSHSGFLYAIDADADASRARDLLPHLDDALAALPATDREAVVLRFFRGLSLRETGAALGTSVVAAR